MKKNNRLQHIILKLKQGLLIKRLRLFMVVAIVASIGTYLLLRSKAATVYAVPASITADCSRSVEVEINNFFKSVPDGSTIQFPANGCYRQDNRLEIFDRNNLVIDGNNSTFRTTYTGKSRINGNWLILRGFNITLKNMISIGTFTAYEGQPRSLATISPDPNFSEANPNYGVYGADTVYLTDVKGYNAWGDSMTTGSSEYVDGSVGVYTKNLFIKRMHAKTAGRMCWGPTSGTNIWIEDSLCEDAWYGGLDAELDNVNQPLQGHHYLRNTFNGFNHFGISVPVAADNSVKSQDIEIRDNIFLTPTDTPQYPVFLIGLYPDNPNTFQNVVIEGNDIKHYCKGIALDHVSSGSVQNNKLTRVFKPGYTPEGICGAGNTDSVSSTNTQNVTFSNNGPDVVLNNTSSTPTPTPTPTPQPSPNPSPTPTNPPPAPSSCQAPANFTGSAGPPGSGRYDFTWSAMNGADGYYLYYATAPDQPATVYSGPFSANSASAFSLVMDRQYNFAVRSRCGSPESSNSNVINVVAPSSSSNTPPSRPSPSKTGDLNNDNKVNITDLSILLSKWNTNATNADLNNDGKVNVIDLSILLSHWG